MLHQGQARGYGRTTRFLPLHLQKVSLVTLSCFFKLEARFCKSRRNSHLTQRKGHEFQNAFKSCGTQNYLRIHLVVLVCSKVLNNSYFLGLESHSAKESTIYSLLPSDLNTPALKYYLCRAVSRTCKLKKLFSYISTKHLSRSHSHTNAQIILEKKCNSRVGWQQKNQNHKLDTCIYILWYIVVLQKETTL